MKKFLLIIIILAAVGILYWWQDPINSYGSGVATIKVLDENQLPVKGVKISLGRLPLGTIDPGHYASRPKAGSGQTNSEGVARFTNLPTGYYSVGIEKSGYHITNPLGSGGFVLSDIPGDEASNQVEKNVRMRKIVSGLDLAVDHIDFNDSNKVLEITRCNHGDRTLDERVPMKVTVNGVERLYHDNFSAGRCSFHGSNVSYWGLSSETPGSYEVSIVVDPDNVFPEVDESNNTLVTSIEIK